MGFILGGLDSEPYDREYSDGELVRRIIGYFRLRARSMTIAAMAMVGDSLFGAAVPIIVSQGIDVATTSPTVGRIGALVAAMLLLRLLAWFLNYVRQAQSARAIGDVVLALRDDAFKAVVNHDLSFHDQQPTGKIVSRLTSDTRDFSNTVDLTMNLFSQILSVAVIAVAAFSINVRLTLLIWAMTPLVFAIALSFRHLARQATRNARRVLAKVNANIQESVSGIAIAKGFRQEQRMYEEFSALNEQAYQVNVVRGLTINTIFPLLTGTFGIVTAIILYFAGASALEGVRGEGGLLAIGAITVGEWYLFMQAMGRFWFPMTNIASFWSQFQDGLSAAERVFSLIDAEPEVVQTDDRAVPDLEGHIDFENVRLSYTGEEIVLPDFSLHITPGETVALVGHTGAGKTSVARLLARLYEFQGGQILVDGMDIRTLDLIDYRRHLGFVPQTAFLFSGTVCDNIRYARPEASRQEVEDVAMRVGTEGWIEDLPQGLQTEVGERGTRLSMGQRQLVALARVLLNDPAIFILDEATASVDPFTEAQIQEGLELVMEERTSIVIAHRLSTVRNVDRIIVMREGRIIEEGDHETLMEKGGHYAELYETYFRHQSLEYVEEMRRPTS
ncbi:MAG: ABC transporter ATP-binding protein [Anaerolineae bacterium]